MPIILPIKVDKLKAEVVCYKDKLQEADSLRSQFDQLQEDNRVLEETKEVLVEQLSSTRKRCEEVVLSQENEIKKYRENIDTMKRERSRINNLIDQTATFALNQNSSLGV